MILGEIGHIAIILSLVSAFIAAYCYWMSERANEDTHQWKNLARGIFVFHFAAIVTAAISLFIIICSHQFQFQYAWKHSSLSLPIHYVIACFWEGQEGSFLVWVFWNALIGLILIKTSGIWETRVLLIFSIVQVFITSMILGVVIFGTFKIGQSPFMLLKDMINDPMFIINPDFVPKDGNGLNPLLQNIWMVIHPPIIFLGFALALVPFAFALAGLINRDLIGWILKAQIWLGFSIGILGLGIMMGAYWAYETLNFGGYWNWDPVENAILVPWLVMLGAMHGLVLFQKKKPGLLFSTLLVLLSFVLVVYATFLTRSGILGDSSVHSFTDLGLSGQLLFFLLAVIGSSIYFIGLRWRSFVVADDSMSKYSLVFWMQMGIAILCLAAFQILMPTSIPVFATILESFGLDDRIAPPADPVSFYNRYQLWFAVAFGLTMGIAQMYSMRRIQSFKDLEVEFSMPLLSTLLISAGIIRIGAISDWKYILLISSAVFGGSVCVKLLIQNFNKNLQIAGPLAHVGFVVMILGFVFSAGYAKLVSKNITIDAPNSSLPTHLIQEHALLNRNMPKPMGEYSFTYLGAKVPLANGRGEVNKDDIIDTNYEDYKVLSASVYLDNGEELTKGDTVKVNNENIYYEIAISKGDNRFILKPRLQNNPKMGYVASPDIHSFWNKDIYVHVSNFPDPSKIEWSEAELFIIIQDEAIIYKGIEVRLLETALVEKFEGYDMSNGDLAIVANIEIVDGQNSYLSRPVYMIKSGKVRLYPDENRALGIRSVIQSIDPKTGHIQLALSSSQRDWITIKAKEMPMISLVWIGTLIMVLGIGVMVVQKVKAPRVQTSQFMKVIYRNHAPNNIPIIEEHVLSNKQHHTI